MVTMNFWHLIGALSFVLVPFLVIAQDDLELRVQVLEATVVQINDDVNNVETNLGNVENDVSQNTGQIFEIVNDLDDMDDVNDLQETRIGAVEEENSLLRARLDQMEVLLSSLSGEVHALNETVSDLDIDNSTNERLDVLESDVTTLENIVTTQGTNITNLENDLTDLDERLDDLEENNGAANSDTAFFATHSEVVFTPSDPIVFNLPIINPGSNYNPESGIYTVPVDGIYQFVLHYRNSNDVSTAAYLKVDNIVTAYVLNRDDAYIEHSAEMTILLSLNSGQQVWLSPSDIGGMYGTNSGNGAPYSWFSGHMIYPL